MNRVQKQTGTDSPKPALRKTSFTGLFKDKKFTVKVPWRRTKSIDEETLQKVDEFVHDVIEKAKQEYLTECNGVGLNDYHNTREHQHGKGRIEYYPAESEEDDNDDDEENKDNTNDRVRVQKLKFTEGSASSHNGTDSEKTAEKLPNQERKPLLDKTGEGGCTCLGYLYKLICCHCVCRNYEIT